MAVSLSRPDSSRTSPPSPSRSAVKETTALGAGYLAGIRRSGLLEMVPDDIADLWKEDRRFEPQHERRPKSLPLRRLAKGHPTRLSLGTRVTPTTFSNRRFSVQNRSEVLTYSRAVGLKPVHSGTTPLMRGVIAP